MKIPVSIREDCSERFWLGDYLHSPAWGPVKSPPSPGVYQSLIQDWPSPNEFHRAVKAIRRFGENHWIDGAKVSLLNVNEYAYWTNPGPASEKTLILRKRSFYQTGYDWIAPNYDPVFRNTESMHDLERIRDAVEPAVLLSGLSTVLDVGCGTGGLLDLAGARPAVKGKRKAWMNYVGIDKSSSMLRKFVAKYPTLEGQVHVCSVADYWPGEVAANPNMLGFDLIAAMFGSGAFLTVADVFKLFALLKATGRMIVMDFKPEHTPAYFVDDGVARGGFNPETEKLLRKAADKVHRVGHHRIYDIRRSVEL